MLARISARCLFTRMSMLVAAASWASSPAAGPEPIIQSIEIRGTKRSFELESRVGDRLDRQRLSRDLQRLWRTKWFSDIRVLKREQADGVALAFEVVDKPRFSLREVQFEPETEEREVSLEPGAKIDWDLAREAALQLEQELIEQGFAEARVEADLIDAGAARADLRLKVERGPRYRVSEVDFSGPSGMRESDLRKQLQATKSKRLLPGVPGLWRGWRLRPNYSDARLEGDLVRLRSAYIERGYLDALVQLDDATFVEPGRLGVTVETIAGPRYRVAKGVVTTPDGESERLPVRSGEFPAKQLCRCLTEARGKAEREGRVDFAVEVELSQAAAPDDELADDQRWVSLTARVRDGPPFTIARIDFRGNHKLRDSTLRKALAVDEGEIFDGSRLRRGLKRLGQIAVLEPVGDRDLLITRELETHEVRIAITVKEKGSRRWSLSGPAGPISLFGPLQFAIQSRLPPWGRGALELSTYVAGFSFAGFQQPVLRAFSWEWETLWLPALTLQRPHLPGQAWTSGFLLSPQLSWKETALVNGITRVATVAHNAVSIQRNGKELALPIWWASSRPQPDPRLGRPMAGWLLCQEQQPRLRWLRSIASLALGTAVQ